MPGVSNPLFRAFKLSSLEADIAEYRGCNVRSDEKQSGFMNKVYSECTGKFDLTHCPLGSHTAYFFAGAIKVCLPDISMQAEYNTRLLS